MCCCRPLTRFYRNYGMRTASRFAGGTTAAAAAATAAAAAPAHLLLPSRPQVHSLTQNTTHRKIRVGPEYQAVLPPFPPAKK